MTETTLISPPVSARTVPCAHCGLPAPAVEGEPSFCCTGCEMVYRALHDAGLDETFYHLRDVQETASGRADETRLDELFLAEIDSPAFLAAHTTIEPYGATLGLVHASGSPVERADAVRSMEGVADLHEEEQHLGGTPWQVLSYTLGGMTYREYLTAKGDGTVRLLFWTTPDQAAWLERESVPVVESYVDR